MTYIHTIIKLFVLHIKLKQILGYDLHSFAYNDHFGDVKYLTFMAQMPNC